MFLCVEKVENKKLPRKNKRWQMLCHDTEDEKLCPDTLHVEGYTLFGYWRQYCFFDVNSVHCLPQKDHLLLLF